MEELTRLDSDNHNTDRHNFTGSRLVVLLVFDLVWFSFAVIVIASGSPRLTVLHCFDSCNIFRAATVHSRDMIFCNLVASIHEHATHFSDEFRLVSVDSFGVAHELGWTSRDFDVGSTVV